MWTPNRVERKVVHVYDGDNAYLEEQADGNYILHFADSTMEVSAKDVESGLYDFYPIVEYQEDDKNVFVEFFMTIQENIKDILLKWEE